MKIRSNRLQFDDRTDRFDNYHNAALKIVLMLS